MKVPAELQALFDSKLEQLQIKVARERGLISAEADPESKRWISRSLVPHLRKLSDGFNRISSDKLGTYFSEERLLAYFLYFFPINAFRLASVFAEMNRLGFLFGDPSKRYRVLEWGSGPGTATSALALCSRALGIRSGGAETHMAWIDQSKAALDLGVTWNHALMKEMAVENWTIEKFVRPTKLDRGLLPQTAPQFDLFVFCYFLNELSESPSEIAAALANTARKHLDPEGVIVVVEPALKTYSRKLLEIRRELLTSAKLQAAGLRVLLPCLGEQACGALAETTDWCHEEVSWWRPPLVRACDAELKLDHKSLPFSYLVLTKSQKGLSEILPQLKENNFYRLVSPLHGKGKSMECYVCGATGKHRALIEKSKIDEKLKGRGDILAEVEWADEAGPGQQNPRAKKMRKFGRTV